MRKPTPFIGVPSEMIQGSMMSRTGSINFVALCSRCGVPCLPGEIDEHPPEVRWGEYRDGEPVCDPCFMREPEPANPTEKQDRRIMESTYTKWARPRT